jgi:hypothetical protein
MSPNLCITGRKLTNFLLFLLQALALSLILLALLIGSIAIRSITARAFILGTVIQTLTLIQLTGALIGAATVLGTRLLSRFFNGFKGGITTVGVFFAHGLTPQWTKGGDGISKIRWHIGINHAVTCCAAIS